jgi:hypothetical protein
MGLDEVGTLRTLTAYRVIIDRLIPSHWGRIFNTAGDSVLAGFASAVDAVQCAVEMLRGRTLLGWGESGRASAAEMECQPSRLPLECFREPMIHSAHAVGEHRFGHGTRRT